MLTNIQKVKLSWLLSDKLYSLETQAFMNPIYSTTVLCDTATTLANKLYLYTL